MESDKRAVVGVDGRHAVHARRNLAEDLGGHAVAVGDAEALLDDLRGQLDDLLDGQGDVFRPELRDGSRCLAASGELTPSARMVTLARTSPSSRPVTTPVTLPVGLAAGLTTVVAGTISAPFLRACSANQRSNLARPTVKALCFLSAAKMVSR